MFSISQISYGSDLDSYLFAVNTITPIVFEVTAESQSEWEDDIVFYASVNGKKFMPLLYKDINENNNPLTKNYILYLDTIVKYYMDDYSDFNQTLESESEVGVVSYFDLNCYIANLTSGLVVSSYFNATLSFIQATQQFGERGYIAIDTELTQYLNQNEDSDITTPEYNYDTYNCVLNIPYYIYFLISSDLASYYNFFIGGKFQNKYAINHDETEIFTNEQGIYFII